MVAAAGLERAVGDKPVAAVGGGPSAGLVGRMALAGGLLGVAGGVEAPGPLTPWAAHPVRGAAEAGDQLSATATGGAGTGIVLHRGDSLEAGRATLEEGWCAGIPTVGSAGLSVGSERR